MVRIEFSVCRSDRTGRAARDEVRGALRSREAEVGEIDRVFFTATESRADPEAVGGDAQARVVVEAAPVAALVVTQAEFLLQLLIVALDAPAQFGLIDRGAAGGSGIQGGQYCRATPTECVPFLGMPVSWIIQPRMRPRRSMMGGAWARRTARSASSDQPALATKWYKD